MNKHVEAELKVVNLALATTGLDVVTRIIPRKIIELQQIIGQIPVPGSPLLAHTTSASDRPDKKRKLFEDSYLTDPHTEEPSVLQTRSKSMGLDDAYSIMKAESIAMVQLTDHALAWFLLSYGSGKDTRRKNVKLDQESRAIQQELLSELHRAQEVGINMHTSITKNHLSRADLWLKMVEHPEIEDYTLALCNHDEHQILLLRQNIRDLRNVYLVLYDLVKVVLG